jgi:hypothetical protein
VEPQANLQQEITGLHEKVILVPGKDLAVSSAFGSAEKNLQEPSNAVDISQAAAALLDVRLQEVK